MSETIVTAVSNTQTILVNQPSIAVAVEDHISLVSEGLQGPAGQGVPAGGTAGQLLSKNSKTDFDTVWGEVDLATQVAGNLPFANIADIASQTILGRQGAGIGDIEALTTPQIRDMIGFQHGLSTAGETSINQTISASSTFLQSIPLNSASWTHGILMVRDNNPGLNCGALIIFSTETNKAAGLGGNPFYTAAGAWIAGARVRLSIFDGHLTDNIFAGSTNTYEIRINSVRINGSAIEIVWRNFTSLSRTINTRMRWFLWRGDQVNA
ncbi:MAG: hypothetical protein LW823_04520 [Rickettsiales bacterium]|jgi:hypothetical protein|nr:hypothetical protein [Rickettsiales bacterium]